MWLQPGVCDRWVKRSGGDYRKSDLTSWSETAEVYRTMTSCMEQGSAKLGYERYRTGPTEPVWLEQQLPCRTGGKVTGVIGTTKTSPTQSRGRSGPILSLLRRSYGLPIGLLQDRLPSTRQCSSRKDRLRFCSSTRQVQRHQRLTDTRSATFSYKSCRAAKKWSRNRTRCSGRETNLSSC